jgi:hypothetical protein
VASVVLPCVCDTVSFNPSNPSMIAVTATSARHDGVGGGHAGGTLIKINFAQYVHNLYTRFLHVFFFFLPFNKHTHTKQVFSCTMCPQATVIHLWC